MTILSGTFSMGSPANEPCRYANEDQRQVKLTHDIEMQTTEVTQGDFKALMGYNPSSFTSCGTSCPVERVNWSEAAAYCNALSTKAAKAACYTCSGGGASVTCKEAGAFSGSSVYTCPGYRLPTEAEWQHAYRAGTPTAYYSGVNDAGTCALCSATDGNADAIAWYCANSAVSYAGCTSLTAFGGPSCAGTHPVGQKQANASGLFDMAGNVWEWCHDWYQGNLGTSAATDPWGAASGSTRAHHGGAWNSQADRLRAAFRTGINPTYRSSGLGFRCVRSK